MSGEDARESQSLVSVCTDHGMFPRPKSLFPVCEQRAQGARGPSCGRAAKREEQEKGKSRRGAGRNRSPARWLYLEDLVLVVLDSAHQRGGDSVLQKEVNPFVVGLSPPSET